MAGKTLSLEFDSDEEIEIFRVKVARYKKTQDDILISLGMIEKNDRQVFSMSMQRQMAPLAPLLATLVFKDKSVTRQYTVKILEDDDNEK